MENQLDRVFQNILDEAERFSLVEKAMHNFFYTFNLYREEDQEEFLHYFPDFHADFISTEYQSLSYAYDVQKKKHLFTIDIVGRYKGRDTFQFIAIFDTQGDLEDNYFYTLV